MREILFKARRVDNGEWVEGGFWLNETPTRQTPHIIDYDGNSWAVDPTTIGQYTGLIDKNGVKIFERDRICYKSENHTVYGIVSFGKIPNNDGKTKHIGCYVEWENDGANMWNVWWRCDIAYWIAEEKCVVCGSIHTTPELMGERTDRADPIEAGTRRGER